MGIPVAHELSKSLASSLLLTACSRALRESATRWPWRAPFHNRVGEFRL